MSKNKVDFSKGIYDARQLGTPRMLLLGLALTLQAARAS